MFYRASTESWQQEPNYVHLLAGNVTCGVTERVVEDVVIETAGNGARSGVRLTIGQSYIIMGKNNTDGQKTIYRCSFPKQLGDMSPYQTFYLFSRGSYSHFRNCRSRRCKIGPDSIGCRYGDMNAGFETAFCLARKHCAREKEGGASGLIMKHVNVFMSSYADFNG